MAAGITVDRPAASGAAPARASARVVEFAPHAPGDTLVIRYNPVNRFPVDKERAMTKYVPRRIGTATVAEGGVVVMPTGVLDILDVRTGDTVSFVRDENGGIVLGGSALHDLQVLRNAFEGAAEEFGVETPEDLNQLISDYRAGKEI